MDWNDEAIKAFNEVKDNFASRVLLNHFNSDANLTLTVDASNVAVGGVLHQTYKGKTEPLAFFSKKLTPSESKYSSFDRELLAIYLNIKHFKYLLEGRIFTVFTDHKPLTSAINSKTERSPRQTRHLEYISQFTTDIKYIRGESNVVADSLSRPFDVDVIGNSDLNLRALHKEQLNDSEIKDLVKDPSKSCNLKLIKVPFLNAELWCELSRDNPRQ